MSVKRFLGANKREVMRQVRATLGPEAMILSSRHTDDGVEILAMADDTLSALEAQATPAKNSVPVSKATPSTENSSDFSALAQRLLAEVQEMRSLMHQTPSMQGQVHTQSHQDDSQNELIRWAQAAGFSSGLTKQLLSGNAQAKLPPADVFKSQLQQSIQTPEIPVELFSEGGVLALVGPTGVGKTTTTAKLAAHYVMQFGPQGLLLVTTDSYRIGAQEQLRIYADLLGVEMVALGEEDGLETLTPHLRDKRLVLIDTVGMSQRDQRLTQRIGQLRSAQGADANTRLVLLLNAASQRDTLYEVVERFRAVAHENGHRIDDCIVTKKDESAQLGAALDTLIQHRLTLHFVSYGQRVPEDMELADPEQLIKTLIESTQRTLAEQAEFQSLYQHKATSLAPTQPAEPMPVRVSAGFQKVYRALREYSPVFSVLELAHDASQQADKEQRDARLSDAYQEAERHFNALEVAGIVWPKATPVARCKWHLPALPLSNSGRLEAIPLTTDFTLPDAVLPKMDLLEQACSASYHLCSALPQADQRSKLKRPWIAVINRNHRLNYEHKAVAALKLQGKMRKHSLQSLRYRSEPAKLELHHLPVTLPETEEAFHLWFGVVKSTQRDAVFVRRHWLSPATQDVTLSVQLLLEQLQVDEIASLSRQSVQRLAHYFGQAQHEPAFVYCGVVMAAILVQLDQDQSPEGHAMRQQLMEFSGRRGLSSNAKLLDALMQLLEARAAAFALHTHLPSSQFEEV